MKIFYKRLLLLLIAATTAFSFVACQTAVPEEQELEIKIEEDAPYSAEVLEYAEQTVYSLVLYAYRQAVVDKMPEKVEDRLRDYASRICDITASEPVTEEQYRGAIKLLADNGQVVIDELLALRAGENTECEKVRELYLDLAVVFGADRVALMMYDCCVLIYDARYERAVEKLEDYGYPWYREEAEALLDEKAVFTESIGREDFSALVRCATAMAEIFSVNTDQISAAFSDAEVLEVIRHLELSEIDIDEKGWRLLLSYSLQQKNSSYRAELYDILNESGDIDKLAGVMNGSLELLVDMIERCEAEDIALLRAGKREEFIASAFSHFDQENWELFRTVTSVSLANDSYSELAIAEYGEDYLEYLNGISHVSFDQLRAKVGTQDFYQYLVDYIAGICPAMSYEVGYDQSNQD
ncbi:MAG: hypothetical protein E7679_01510 [Ruminococcaceae bacterium]|nr:hypothetical protein [Oscillospiraceae bacterium]